MISGAIVAPSFERCLSMAKSTEERLASAKDENPVLTTGCNRIFRQWIDVAAQREASEECPAEVMRLVKYERSTERCDVVG